MVSIHPLRSRIEMARIVSQRPAFFSTGQRAITVVRRGARTPLQLGSNRDAYRDRAKLRRAINGRGRILILGRSGGGTFCSAPPHSGQFAVSEE